MAALTLFDCFTEDVAEKVHNLGSDQFVVALCAAANAPTASDTVLTDLTQATYTYCSNRNITTTTSAQTSGTYKLVLADLTLTASGGAVGPFRYAVIYNDTSTSDSLIGYIDRGEDITLSDTDSLTLNFDGSGGALTIGPAA